MPVRERFRAAMGGFPRALYTLLAGMFVNRLASFVITFLALYLVRERGFLPDEAGRVVALFGLGMLVAGPLGGTLADAIGRRTTMLLSLVVGAGTVATIGFVREPAALAALTLVVSVTSEAYRPAFAAAIADLVPPVDRARAWAATYWVVNLGFAFGLALGGVLAAYGFRLLFLTDAATTLVFAAILARGVPETRPHGMRPHSPVAGLARVFADGPFVGFVALNLLSLVVFVQFQLAAPLDMNQHGLGPGTFATLLAMNGVGCVVLQPLTAAWLSRYDGARLLAASSLLIGAGYGVNALAGVLPPLPVYATGVALWTLGEVVGFPTAAAIVADLAPIDLRGRYQGVFSMSWGLAFMVAPILGGEMLTRHGGPMLWLTCLGLCVAVAAGHLATAGPRRRRLAELREAVPPAA